MLTGKTVFQAKVQEIEEYYKFLQYAVIEDSRLHCPNKRAKKEKIIEDDLKKILKANCFLLLYNLVESSIRSGVRDLYDAIISDNLGYVDLKEEIKKVWVRQKYSDLGFAAHPDKYRDLAGELIELAITNAVVDFNSERLPSAGTLDAERIRRICKDLGFSIKIHKSARGGEKLLTVREMRNKLAHGLESFAECGRDFSFSDLNQIKNEVLTFLRGVVRSIDAHVQKRKYCA